MKKFSSTTRASSRQILRKERVRTVVTFGVVGILLLFLLPRLIGGIGSTIFSPISQLETWLYQSSENVPSYFRDRQSLIDENEELKKELSFIRTSDRSQDRLITENAELRALLGNDSSTRIGAGVVGRPSMTPHDVLIIDKGSRDGIVKDAPVYASFDTVIGFVGEVYFDSSVVVLATTPGYESTVYIFGPNIYTTAEGEGGGVLRVSVPQDIELSEGDLVAIPSFDTGVFGRISFIEAEPTEPQQRGYVTLHTPLQGLRFVGVGKVPLKPTSFEAAKEVIGSIRADLLSVPVPSGILVETFEDIGTTTATSTEEVTEELQ